MDDELIRVLEIVITVIAAVIALIQHREKRIAAEAGVRAEDEAAHAIAATAEAQDRTARIVSFFDPADRRVTSAPADVPPRSYTMADETKRWITFDHGEEERRAILAQVGAAEKQGLSTYTIEVPTAWYAIEYGLVRSSGKKVP